MVTNKKMLLLAFVLTIFSVKAGKDVSNLQRRIRETLQRQAEEREIARSQRQGLDNPAPEKVLRERGRMRESKTRRAAEQRFNKEVSRHGIEGATSNLQRRIDEALQGRASRPTLQRQGSGEYLELESQSVDWSTVPRGSQGVRQVESDSGSSAISSTISSDSVTTDGSGSDVGSLQEQPLPSVRDPQWYDLRSIESEEASSGEYDWIEPERVAPVRQASESPSLVEFKQTEAIAEEEAAEGKAKRRVRFPEKDEELRKVKEYVKGSSIMERAEPTGTGTNRQPALPEAEEPVAPEVDDEAAL